MFNRIKYWIADKLFERELDEAFDMGIGEGMRRLQLSLVTRVSALEAEAPKSKLPGIAAVKETVPEVFL
jgi:hypothetical protein